MLALYRKYRPQSFAEIIGQDHIVTTLVNAISLGNISHAYLFCGPRGSGKTSIARLFAKAINCEKLKNGEPCNTCSSCTEIMQGNAIDLIEIDAASHRGIDDIRELRDGIKFAPVKSKYKIFIIDECHQLSKDASNALLKTLEEPPAHAIFILATTESHKMLPTILSRCQRYDFKKLQLPEIIEKLTHIVKKENIAFDVSALQLIAMHARGSFRDAESLLDKCISFSGKDGSVTTEEVKELLGIVEIGQVAELVNLLLAKKGKEAIMYINSLAETSVDLTQFTKTLIYYLHQGLLVKMNPEYEAQNLGMSKNEAELLTSQVQDLSVADVAKILEQFMEAEAKMKYANILQLPLELAILNITHA